jgi:hypothetical protein
LYFGFSSEVKRQLPLPSAAEKADDGVANRADGQILQVVTIRNRETIDEREEEDRVEAGIGGFVEPAFGLPLCHDCGKCALISLPDHGGIESKRGEERKGARNEAAPGMTESQQVPSERAQLLLCGSRSGGGAFYETRQAFKAVLYQGLEKLPASRAISETFVLK